MLTVVSCWMGQPGGIHPSIWVGLYSSSSPFLLSLYLLRSFVLHINARSTNLCMLAPWLLANNQEKGERYRASQSYKRGEGKYGNLLLQVTIHTLRFDNDLEYNSPTEHIVYHTHSGWRNTDLFYMVHSTFSVLGPALTAVKTCHFFFFSLSCAAD